MQVRFVITVLALAAILLSLTSQLSHAADVETLVMPGPLIEGHAKLETDCKQCHSRSGRRGQRTLCLACHKKVAADVRGGKGYHGRIKNIDTLECRSCHTDHKGRKADIVRLDRQLFDHGMTDFPLKDAHTQAACESCHRPGKKFREAPTQCIACHRKDDAHKGRLGESCNDCHSTRTWSKTRFDHSKTGYRLEGKHAEVTCNSCHPDQRYKHTPKACYACHRLNDVHGGQFGDKCDSCHSPKAWKTAGFDHDRNTDFPLRGRHADIDCRTCHTADPKKQKLPKDCNSCHRNDDRHKGRYGTKCDTCHTAKAWKQVKFDHDRDTHFELNGKHAKIACDTCHRGSLYRDKLKSDCVSCHRVDDVHKGQQGDKCQQCHNENGWSGKVLFDHGLTRFPLIGQHAVAPCEECHLQATYKGTSSACVDCHRGDDTHKGSLGTDCAACHNPNGWKLWRFDHDRQTQFKLTGAHAGLACAACHREGDKDPKAVPTQCASCHQGDDVHRGGFGQNCERCHTTDTFKNIEIR